MRTATSLTSIVSTGLCRPLSVLLLVVVQGRERVRVDSVAAVAGAVAGVVVAVVVRVDLVAAETADLGR